MKKVYQLAVFLTVLLASSFSVLQAQIAFSNQNALLSDPDMHSGVAMAVADANGDGYDDIIRLDDARILSIDFQQPDGSFTRTDYGTVSNSNQWAMCAADIDNNGHLDVFSGGAYDGVHLVNTGSTGTDFNMTDLPGPGMFVQGSNFADIDNDGWVDIFSCHDDAESRIWRNDGTGNFEMADWMINMATDPVSDNSGNYGSVWTDFDNDGDVDLYIAKCRQGVSNPADPRRINALFVNDGNGNYTEKAEDYNLKIGAQSWTADFQDIDNDGDLDCFITNHDQPNQLLENDGTGVFTDITDDAGLSYNGLPIQGVMRDFDNDGWVDVIVAGSSHSVYKNNGDKTFTEIANPFDNNDMESYAIGDLNHDGFLDVYGGYANIYTNPTNIDDVVWMNEGNDNNWVAFNLQGVESNRSALGARIEIYGPWGIQIREVRSGESYGIMNSLCQHFGLGDATEITNVIIRWPSGIVDEYDDLAINSFHTLIEDNCVAPTATISVNGPTVLCSGETTELTAPAGYTYMWSNGETTQSIIVEEGGLYNVTVFENTECFNTSAAVEIIFDPIEIPTIAVDGETEFCEGGSVILTSSEATAYVWSNSEETQSIEVSESGTYTVTTSGLCDDFMSAEVEVEVWTVDAPMADDVTLSSPDNATLEATGANPHWFDMEVDGNLLGTGNFYVTDVITEETFFYVEDREIFGGGQYFGGLEEHSGDSEYNGNNFNGGITFDALKPFTLVSVWVSTDTPGPRMIELRDSDDNFISNALISIAEAGEHVVEVNMEIEPGTGYLLTTLGSFNDDNLGFNSPRLKRNNENVEYPYMVGSSVIMTGTPFGEEYYYYFYNWEIEEPGSECISDRSEVKVDLSTSVRDLEVAQLQLHPNPTNGSVQLIMAETLKETGQLIIQDATGKNVGQQTLAAFQNSYHVDLADLPKGLYFLQLQAGEQLFQGKVIVQ